MCINFAQLHRMSDVPEAPTVIQAPISVDTVETPNISRKVWIHQFLERWTEKGLRSLFFWESDDKKLGGLIRFFHRGIIYLLIMYGIMVHTVFPSYLLLIGLYISLLLIWIQHIICGGCIVSKIEQKLIGDSSSFVDPILDLFNIPITPESSIGVNIMISTLLVIFITFELFSRTVLNVKSWFNN
jgi:hypothetical protein